MRLSGTSLCPPLGIQLSAADEGTKEYKKRASKDARFLLYPSVAAVKEQRLLFREVERGSKQNVKW